MQHDFILLDRSGSMGGTMWTEALNSINAYVKKLAEDNVDTGVTLIAFDSNEPNKVLRDRITPKTWKNVTDADATPRGGTPLNDATMSMLDLAENGPIKYDKVAIIIMTDGAENASQEFSHQTGGTARVKARLERIRDKGWQVIFLGANFDNDMQAQSYGAMAHSTVSSTVANMGGTMRAMAEKRGMYASGASANMSFSTEEKKKFAER